MLKLDSDHIYQCIQRPRSVRNLFFEGGFAQISNRVVSDLYRATGITTELTHLKRMGDGWLSHTFREACKKPSSFRVQIDPAPR